MKSAKFQPSPDYTYKSGIAVQPLGHFRLHSINNQLNKKEIVSNIIGIDHERGVINEDASSFQPFFSIIIASLNNYEELQKCVASINVQNYTSYEVLISDGGSIDSTSQFLLPKFIRNLSWSKSDPDDGIYHALNFALLEAKGQWILVLGSDDNLSDADALSRAFVFINRYVGKSNLFYADLFIRDLQGIRLKKYPEFEKFCNQFSGAPFIHHQSAFISREAINHCGLFDTKYRINSDYDLMLRVIKDIPPVKVNDAFVVFNTTGYSSQLKNIIQSVSEVCAIRKKFGFRPFNLRLGFIYLLQIVRTVIVKFIFRKI